MSSLGVKDVTMPDGHCSSSKCLTTAAIANVYTSEVHITRCICRKGGNTTPEMWKLVSEKGKTRVQSDKTVQERKKLNYLIIHQSGDSTVEYIGLDGKIPSRVTDYRQFGAIFFCVFCPFGNPVKLVYKNNTILSVNPVENYATPQRYIWPVKGGTIRWLQCDDRSNLVFISTSRAIYKGTWFKNQWGKVTETTGRNIFYLTLNTRLRLIFWCERGYSNNHEDVIFKLDYNGEKRTRLGKRHSMNGLGVDDTGTYLFTCSKGPRVCDLQESPCDWAVFPGYNRQCYHLKTDGSFAYLLNSRNVTIYDVKLMSVVISLPIRHNGLRSAQIETGYHLN